MAKSKGTIHEMRLEPLDDQSGVLAHTTYKNKRSGQGGGPMYDHETQKTHHRTMADLHAHIQEHMGHAFSEGEPEEQAPI